MSHHRNISTPDLSKLSKLSYFIHVNLTNSNFKNVTQSRNLSHVPVRATVACMPRTRSTRDLRIIICPYCKNSFIPHHALQPRPIPTDPVLQALLYQWLEYGANQNDAYPHPKILIPAFYRHDELLHGFAEQFRISKTDERRIQNHWRDWLTLLNLTQHARVTWGQVVYFDPNELKPPTSTSTPTNPDPEPEAIPKSHQQDPHTQFDLTLYPYALKSKSSPGFQSTPATEDPKPIYSRVSLQKGLQNSKNYNPKSNYQ